MATMLVHPLTECSVDKNPESDQSSQSGTPVPKQTAATAPSARLSTTETKFPVATLGRPDTLDPASAALEMNSNRRDDRKTNPRMHREVRTFVRDDCCDESGEKRNVDAELDGSFA